MGDRHVGSATRFGVVWNDSLRRPARRGVRVGVESLEDRRLLSGLISDMQTLPAGAQAGPMAVSSFGKLYYAETGAGAAKLAVLTSADKFSEVALPATDVGGSVTGITGDKSGDVWYAYATPPSVPKSLGGTSVVNVIGEVSPSGTVTEYPLPTGDRPGSMTLGPDGNVWVSIANTANGASLAKVTPDGKVAEFPVKGASSLGWLTSGPDQSLWFTDGAKIGKMSTAGVVTEYGLIPPSGTTVDLGNAQLTPGSDGNLWFIGLGGLSDITPGGQVTTDTTPGTTITALTSAGDGDLWFSFLPASTNSLSSTPGAVVVRMTPSGSTTQLPVRVDPSATTVTQLVAAPDAGVWLNDGGTKVKRIDLASIPTFTPPIVYPTTTTGLTTDGSGNFSGTVVSFTAYDSASKASDFTALINWGDGHTSTGTVAANQNGGFDVTGSNGFSGPVGSAYKVTVTVQQQGLTAQVFNRVTVAAAGASPTGSTPLVVLGGKASLAARRAALASARATLKALRLSARATSHPRGPLHRARPVPKTGNSPMISA